MFTPIPISEFVDKAGLKRGIFDHGFNDAASIVALRDLVKLHQIQLMSNHYLQCLLNNITLAGDPNFRVYQGCNFKTIRTDPRNVLIGQTFVERSKSSAIEEEWPKKFQDFSISGYAKMVSSIILGETSEGELAVAHYLPPIIESFPIGSILLDGVHRCYKAKGVGTTLETIKVYRPNAEFPCTPNHWDAVRSVNEKPPKDERFFDLKPDLFRDLKGIGIDG